MIDRATLVVDGRPVAVARGATLAAALLDLGIAPRRSVSGAPRAALCGMGVCFECRATVDGEPHVRTCMVRCREGMEVRTDAGSPATSGRASAIAPAAGDAGVDEAPVDEAPDDATPVDALAVDVLVVGAGPAGVAAARAAAARGARVAVVDDQPAPGGQIWRAAPGGSPATSGAPASPGARWVEAARRAGAVFHHGLTAFDAARVADGVRVDAIDAAGAVHALRTRRVILATGARERFLPFPGWTLPGVLGVGGIQALVKGGLDVRGRRVAVAGSGPLLLAVADALRARGAAVVGVFEQASAASVRRFGAALVRHPRKLAQAAGLLWRLRGVPRHHDAWPARAFGAGRVERVVLRVGRSEREVAVDYLACGFGLVPRSGLASRLSCAVAAEPGAADHRVVVDDVQRCRDASGGAPLDVYCAGEACGVGGVDLALAEGVVAGLAAAGDDAAARGARPRRDREREFVARLDAAFALRPELRGMGDDDTILCRCEDVPIGAVRTRADLRAAKLETRCGMGPCQGRVCGAAARTLLGFAPDRVRPPLYPVPMSALARE